MLLLESSKVIGNHALPNTSHYQIFRQSILRFENNSALKLLVVSAATTIIALPRVEST